MEQSSCTSNMQEILKEHKHSSDFTVVLLLWWFLFVCFWRVRQGVGWCHCYYFFLRNSCVRLETEWTRTTFSPGRCLSISLSFMICILYVSTLPKGMPLLPLLSLLVKSLSLPLQLFPPAFFPADPFQCSCYIQRRFLNERSAAIGNPSGLIDR